MLQKSQFFYFILSFAVTFVVGFFIWNIFISPDNGVMNQILSEASKIGLSFSVASVSNSGIENIVQATDPEQNASSESPVENGDIEGQNSVVAPTESFQDQLDDIQEKLDIISQQVQELIAEQNPDNQLVKIDKDKVPEDKKDKDQNKDDDKIDNKNTEDTNKNSNATIYPKILISEIQAAGVGDDKQEFIELYNPNNTDIDLTGWYLQKKTSSGTVSYFDKKSLFSNQKILANSYFLIVRAGYFGNLANVSVDDALSDNSSLIFSDPNDVVSDEASWSQIADGLSFGRKWNPADNAEQDFELQTPTPKSQNITYVAPPTGGGGGGSGGGVPIIPTCKDLDNILISEFQVEGETVNDDWVELYNPNDDAVCLGGWSIQKASITGNISKVKNFGSEAIIAGKNYFLTAKSNANQNLIGLVDMEASGLDLSSEFAGGNTIYLVGKKEVIGDENDPDVIDEVGYGMASDFKIMPALKPSAGKSTGRIWDETLNGYKNSENNSTDFELGTPTPKAQNVAYVAPLPEPTPEPLPEPFPPAAADTTPPEVSFNLDSIQNSLNFPINFSITDLLGTTTPSGVGSYIFQWQEEGGDWQEDSSVEIGGGPVFADFVKDFTGEDGKTYYFQVKATNAVGNASEWLPVIPATIKIVLPSPPPPPRNILINEIQIEAETTKDDWVELYNPNDFEFDISSWSIQRSPKSGNIYKKDFETGNKIGPNGYFLIVRNDANQALLDVADMTCSALQLSSDGTVYLVKNQEEILDEDDSDIIDKVGWGQAHGYETRPAPIPDKNQSIARKILGEDTNDNSQDFIISDTPSPKE